MGSNHSHTDQKHHNLLNDLEFLLNLKFEATYASVVRGGHSPSYIDARKKKRLVSAVNLLAQPEVSELILKFPTFQN